MLNVQEYLRRKSIAELEDSLAIKCTRHPVHNNLITLNYDQLNSPKHNPIVKECRGIVVDEKYNFDLVAKSFNRFFNLGEDIDMEKTFKWTGFTSQEKVDGSLMMLFCYDGQWMVKTRASWCQEKMQGLDLTFADLFWKAFDRRNIFHLNPLDTYVFELCSPYNKVVREYRDTTVYLLAVVQCRLDHWREFTIGEVKALYESFNWHGNVLMPDIFSFSNIDEITSFIKNVGKDDPTYEGLVIRDVDNMRLKVKSPEYLALHRLGSDKACLFAPKNLIPFILNGEGDELLAYFSEAKEKYYKYKAQIDKAWKELDNIWYCHHDQPSQKKFAMAVKDHPLAGVLFEARKTGRPPREIFLESTDLILKRVIKD